MRRQVELSGAVVLAVAGGIAWLVGSTALPSGQGTVVLALGIAVTVWLAVRAVRAGGGTPRLDGDRRRRVVTLVVVGIGLVVAGSMLLRATSRSELAVPLAAGICGALLIPLASLVERRGLLAVGAGFLLLGAWGAVLALNSAGRVESTSLIGFVGGLLLWAAAAQQAGLVDELRGHIRR